MLLRVTTVHKGLAPSGKKIHPPRIFVYAKFVYLTFSTTFRWVWSCSCRAHTMCIVNKGFRGFRAFSPASILGGNLKDLKPEIPYDTIHSML